MKRIDLKKGDLFVAIVTKIEKRPSLSCTLGGVERAGTLCTLGVEKAVRVTNHFVTTARADYKRNLWRFRKVGK
jgi:hypothetical protein